MIIYKKNNMVKPFFEIDNWKIVGRGEDCSTNYITKIIKKHIVPILCYA